MKKLISALLAAILCTCMMIPAMAAEPTFESTKNFIAVLDENDLAYTYRGMISTGEEHIVMENEDENFAYTINLYFNADGDCVNVFVWYIIEFEDEDFTGVLRVVNELNSAYKYTRFYIDESDNTVTCAMNIIVLDEDASGDIVLEALLRMASILKHAYPQLVMYNK